MKAAKTTRKLHVLPGGKRADGQSQYEILFENASDAMLVVDLASRKIVSVNAAALELTGYLRDEIQGQLVDTLFPKDWQLRAHSQGMTFAHLENNGFFEEITLTSKDGHPRYVSLSVRAMPLGRRQVAMCILRDVAEKKNMERDLITKHSELRNAYVSLEKANAELKSMQETLVQSGKLAALGELAAGIAHELNQPLTAVRGFAQEAMSEVGTTGEKKTTLENHLKEIVSGADKMERIISHLRNFTRKSTEDFQMADVHSVIDESLVMLNKQLTSRGVKVERDYATELPRVYCNPFQLEQVFINLATNARDAIEAKGENKGLIKIRTRAEAEGVIVIQYEDNGCGIADVAKGKIFNPFFTTKEVGKGMGLGLSISYGILSRINASILVESTVGKGTVFTIKLPVDYRKH
jgi:PAS domain S-box-containing protein